MLNGDAFYGVPSWAVVSFLFLLILAANEVGFRIAERARQRADSGIREQTNAIQAAMLGLLALLLGFAFSMALQRFDSRSQAVVDEANAIGTAWLRADLLPGELAPAAKAHFAEYIRLRVEATQVDAASADEMERSRAATAAVQRAIWEIALQGSRTNPNPVVSGYFVQSVNEMIDEYDARQAELDKHVPEEVLVLLFSVFVCGAGLLGYNSGLIGRRPVVATVVMALLITLVIFTVIDLDRPRRGMIQVRQQPILALQGLIEQDAR
jgi:hypothetical protein